MRWAPGETRLDGCEDNIPYSERIGGMCAWRIRDLDSRERTWPGRVRFSGESARSLPLGVCSRGRDLHCEGDCFPHGCLLVHSTHLAPLLPTSVAMSALKRLLTGHHKLEKHHSLPSNTEARPDRVFQPRARPSLPLRLTLGLPPTHRLPYPWVADGAILHLLSPPVIEIFIPAGAGVDLAQSRNVSSPKTPGLPVYPRFDTTCGTEKSSYDAVSPLFLYADSCGFSSPSVPLGSAQG